MSTTEVSTQTATGDASAPKVPFKLEAVVIPVTDVDRAKAFYSEPRVEARRRLRLRQRLPGRPVHPARLGLLGPVRHEDHLRRARLGPGPVPDRLRHRGRPRRARRPRRRRQRGVPPRRRRAPSSSPTARTVASAGRRPEHASYSSFATFSDPDGNGWLLQEITTRLPGRIDAARDVVRVGRRPGAARCGAPRRPTASTRSAPGSTTRTGRTGTPPTWSPSRAASNSRPEQ